jgi:hypothetical protein
MSPLESLLLAGTLITGIGCVTGIVITTVDKVFDRRLRGASEDLARARDRIHVLEDRVADLQLHNEQLARTQEWTNRLLDAPEPSRLPAPPIR